MDKIDERYKRGKIYTIRCRYDDSLIYVGSTIQKLCKRIGHHRIDKKCSLYQLVNGDWNNWYIELYEEYPCDNKNLLLKREGEIIRLIGTINKCIAGRTKEEWRKENYETNKDIILEKAKEYRENNKDKINEIAKYYRQANKEKLAENNKEYREANKEKIAEKNKEWRENNKDKIAEINKVYYQDNANKISEKHKEKIECNKCKSIVRRGDLAKHQRTKKCLNYNVDDN